MKRSKVVFWIALTAMLCSFGILAFRIGYDVKTWNFGGRIDVRRGNCFDYVLCLPKGYTDFSGKRPLLIYLHGAGGVGKDLSSIDETGAFYEPGEGVTPAEFPFIVLRPVTPTSGWKPELVIRFLDAFLADKRFRYKIDETRIYLTGYSMGGFGTFDTAAEYPDRFAAIAPLAGGSDPREAEKLQTVPTWAFHGDRDDTVPLESTQKIIDAMIKQNHRNLKLTVLSGFGHDIWGEVYNRPELYQWLLEQKLPHSNKGENNEK